MLANPAAELIGASPWASNAIRSLMDMPAVFWAVPFPAGEESREEALLAAGELLLATSGFTQEGLAGVLGRALAGVLGRAFAGVLGRALAGVLGRALPNGGTALPSTGELLENAVALVATLEAAEGAEAAEECGLALLGISCSV